MSHEQVRMSNTARRRTKWALHKHLIYIILAAIRFKRPIDCLFFLPALRNRQRSNSACVWNQVLLSVWCWCIAELKGSHLCKHILSKPKDKCVAVTPIASPACEQAEGDPEGWWRATPAEMALLLQMKRVKQSRLAGPACQCHYLTLSEMINGLK